MAGYSLHIGLNRVDPDEYHGWSGELYACLNDARAMEGIARANGYVASSLHDEQATADAVMQSIDSLADRSVAGDLCLVTYAGHGGSVDDVSGDEPDGKDETWCLYDRQLLDDELAYAWSEFARGVRVLVVSDSCHSGTVTRDPDKPRVRGLPSRIRAAEQESRGEEYARLHEQARRRTAGIRADILLMSGCEDDEESSDGVTNGAFTTALLSVWADGAFAGDLRTFHAQVLSAIGEGRQHPRLNTDLLLDQSFLDARPFAFG